MDAKIILLHLIVAVVSTLFIGIGTLVTILLPLFRRNERSTERLDAKLDRFIEQSQLRVELKELDAKLGRSIEQLRVELKELDAKLDRSTEQLRAELKELDAKLDRFIEQDLLIET